jgi:hypothetical protein
MSGSRQKNGLGHPLGWGRTQQPFFYLKRKVYIPSENVSKEKCAGDRAALDALKLSVGHRFPPLDSLKRA